MATTLDELRTCREAFVAALAAKDGRRAQRIVVDAVEEGASVEAVYLEVLQWSLVAVGREWETGAVTVAEEHFATAIVEQLLGQLGVRMRVPPYGGRMAIVAGTPGERHGLGARMVADFLEADGWEVLHLGASMPSSALVTLVETEVPDLVALSTSTPSRLPGARKVLRALAALEPRPLVVVGGQAWLGARDADARQLGVDAVLIDPRMLVAHARRAVPPRAE